MSYVTVFDDAIIGFLGQFAARNVALDHLIRDIANSDLLKGGVFMAYFWWLWFRGDGDVAERRKRVLVAIAGALVAVVVSRTAQRLLPIHPRPLHAGDPAFVLPFGVDPATLSHWSSFPSDHAALFFALSLAVWRESRLGGALAMLWTLLVVCLPRIYLGFHYPSDVIGGIVLGAVIMPATWLALGGARLPTRILHWEASHRTAFYLIAFLTTYEITIFYDLRQLVADSAHLVQTIVVAHA